MPLRHVQAAFRDMVLHSTTEFSSGARSAHRIVTTTPGLRARERDALARIPRERLAVYHDLVVGGHQSMLGWTFATTLAVLGLAQKSGPRATKPMTFRAMIEAFLLDGPASTHSLRELADRFRAFLRKTFGAAFERVPVLGELAAIECARLDVEYALDGSEIPATRAVIERIAQGTVDDLLQTTVVVPRHVQFFRMRHNVKELVTLVRDRRRELRTVHQSVRRADEYLALTRDPESLLPRIVELDAPAWRQVRAARGKSRFRLESLAVRRAQALGSGEGGEAAAIAEVVGWLAHGLLALAAPARDHDPKTSRSKRTEKTSRARTAASTRS